MFQMLRGFLASVLTAAVLLTSGMAAAADTRQTYIVLPKDGASSEVRQLIASLGEFPEEQFIALDGMFIIDLLPQDAAAVAASEFVAFIEQDAVVSNTGTQSPAPSWGLDQIDGTTDSAFSFPDQSGAGVNAYVFDTGVAADHPDLIGRVTQGFDAFGQNQANTDCHFHGTHVAATIAGEIFGVAKKATVVPLKVLNCAGFGSMTGIIRAINWTIGNHPVGTPGVANFSLGGGRNLALNAAITNLVEHGITSVVAAGNSRTDACGTSPASALTAITVGATDRFANRASFSNFGECLDIFAPGVSIPSADARDYSRPIALSGTSMAAPHVAGVAALIIGANPAALPDQVEAAIYRLSRVGAVNNSLTGVGNRLAVSPPEGAGSIPTLSGAPTGLIASSAGSGFVNFSWNEVQGALGYQVEYRKGSQNFVTLENVSGTQFSVLGLAGGEQAFLRVRAVADTLTTRFSPTATGRAATELASEPRNLLLTALSKDGMVMTWEPPLSLGGASFVRYRIEIKTDGDWRSTSNESPSLRISNMLVPHHFRVSAINEAGVSAPSPEVTFDPSQVFAVGSLVGEIESGSNLNLSWTSDAPSDSRFEISLLRSGTTTPETITVQGNQHRFTGLAKLATYRVSVVPVGAIRGLGSFITVTTRAVAPAAPRALGTTRVDTGWQLRFSAPADNGGAEILSYRLEELTASGWTPSQTGTSTTFLVPPPARAQTLEYRLIAINSVGDSQPSSNLRVSSPAERPSAPQSFSASIDAQGRVLMDWSAPLDDGGSAVSSYRVETLRGGAWSLIATSRTLTMSSQVLAKGAAASYRVLATNAVGASEPSSVIEEARPTTLPADVSNFFTSLRDGVLRLSWSAIRDDGGSPLLGYRLEQRGTDGWIPVGDLINSTSHTLSLGAPGTQASYRILASTAVGFSAGATERLVTFPFVAPSAPADFSVTREGNGLRFSWTEPASLGGSTLSGFVVSASTDGAGFVSVATARAGDRSVVFTRAAPGKTTLYRVQATTLGFGWGLPSEPVAMALPATVPSDPQNIAAVTRAGEGILLSWTAPLSDGGSPLTGYRVELAVGRGWNVLGSTQGTSMLVPLGAPGETMLHRVVATNEVGSSIGSRNFLSRMGVSPATAPLSLSAAVQSGRLNLSWAAPEVMGGQFSSYEIQVLDGGVFKRLSTTRSLSFLTTLPALGTSLTYRVAAITNAGTGAYSAALQFDNPKTVPGAPVLLSMTSVGRTNTVTWRTTSFATGGGTIDALVLYREQAGQFVEVARASAASGTLSFENNLFGETHRYALRLSNEVGESPNSTVRAVRHAVVVTSPATGLTLVPQGTGLLLRWSAPDFIGGSAPSFVDIESSSNGSTWTRAVFMSNATSRVMTMPAKGRSLSFRVVLRNAAGNSLPSEAVSFTNPFTAPATNFSASAVRVGDRVQFRISAPTDFGGYATLAVRIERQGALAWQSSEEFVLTSPGSRSTFSLPLPGARGTYSYRIVLANPSGEVDRVITFRH